MPLSLNSPLNEHDIQSIMMLKGEKVWLLTGQNDDKIVIKTEADSQDRTVQFKSANVAVKAIDPRAKLKILTESERKSLQIYIISCEEYWRMCDAANAKVNTEERQAILELKKKLEKREQFVKMEALHVTDLEKTLIARLGDDQHAADKSGLRTFAATLKATGGLEKLGRIIAVDLFNGNTDRFFPGGREGMRKFSAKGQEFDLHVLINVGNVFLATTDRGSEVGALDFIDPSSQYKDISIPLSRAEEDCGAYKWPGRTLADKKLRDEFAAEVVHDLELLLSPHRSKYSPFTKLGRDATARVSKGMLEGAKLIRERLERKYNIRHKDWPIGARDRYMVLWGSSPKAA